MKEELLLVSIVTPSYNKGAFIEETILSVKNQTYPRVEHIVIDGGSTDGTLDILRKYNDSIVWVSEPDEGQSDAINRGWRKARGEIIAYLNADDTYTPWAVETAVKFLTDHPDVSMVYGDCNIVNECNEVVGRCPAREFDLKEILCLGNKVPQPAVFLRREVLNEVGYLDTNLHMAMDYDLWVRIGLRLKIQYVPKTLANFRSYLGTKTVSEGYKIAAERFYIVDKIFSNPELPEEVKALKRRAYSYAHFKAGESYHFQRQMKPARKHLVKAIRLNPRNLVNPWVAGYLVTSLLGRRATDIVVKWKSKLVSKLK